MKEKERVYMKGFPGRAAAIIGRTTRDIFVSKGIIFAMFFLMIPSFISIYSLVDPSEGMKEWWNLFAPFGLFLFLQIMVLIYSLIYGSSMVNEDIENRTMTYLIIRGARKSEVYLFKYIGTVLSLFIMFSVSIITTYILLSAHGSMNTMLVKTDMLLALIGAAYVGIIVYTALFSLMGVVFKRPLMAGLLYAFFWEIIIVNIPFNIRYATMMHYVRSIFCADGTTDSVLELDSIADPLFSVFFLLGISALLLFLGCLSMKAKDIH
ncbi:MAG: hypothetical protein JW939_01820 [Candidatus Thermoplasmatota archaeon]|nr:hypothetical protein [Candidatus Thermoplasmatota archaeon]